MTCTAMFRMYIYRNNEFTRAQEASGVAMPTVASLHVYPVKSCSGIKLESAVLTDKGRLLNTENT
jgi:hypothetical protein